MSPADLNSLVIWGMAVEMMRRSYIEQFRLASSQDLGLRGSTYQRDEEHANENGYHQQRQLESCGIDNIGLILALSLALGGLTGRGVFASHRLLAAFRSWRRHAVALLLKLDKCRELCDERCFRIKEKKKNHSQGRAFKGVGSGAG